MEMSKNQPTKEIALNEKQHLYYALGQLAYAVAKADGQIKKEEKEQLHKIVTDEVQKNIYDFHIADIIFDILQKDKKDFETTYNWAIHSMKLGKHHFSEQMKDQFLHIIKKVVNAFPPTSMKEKEIIDRFSQDLKNL